jgi:hypothetical protein
MRFELERAVQILSATPAALKALLGGLDDAWTATRGDIDAPWEVFDIVGHLIHGEETDWIPRARIILDQSGDSTFTPFDRFAQFERSKGKALAQMLAEFEDRRADSLATLRSWRLTPEQLDLKGRHPELGEVDLRQLLATWVVHDLTHLRQIATALAKKYGTEVGPWRECLSILN